VTVHHQFVKANRVYTQHTVLYTFICQRDDHSTYIYIYANVYVKSLLVKFPSIQLKE